MIPSKVPVQLLSWGLNLDGPGRVTVCNGSALTPPPDAKVRGYAPAIGNKKKLVRLSAPPFARD